MAFATTFFPCLASIGWGFFVAVFVGFWAGLAFSPLVVREVDMRPAYQTSRPRVPSQVRGPSQVDS
jgi:hypothetical protein